MVFRAVVLALPCALALKLSHPRGDYNIKGGSSATSFPEFNVQYYYPGSAAASLHGATEANSFTAAVDKVLEKQSAVIEALETSAKRSFLMEGGGEGLFVLFDCFRKLVLLCESVDFCWFCCFDLAFVLSGTHQPTGTT